MSTTRRLPATSRLSSMVGQECIQDAASLISISAHCGAGSADKLSHATSGANQTDGSHRPTSSPQQTAMVRSLARGFALLWKNFKTHLEFGLQGWLFGGLQEKNITPPALWTDPKALFFFVLDVLGLSVAHVFDLLKQRFNPERVEALRTWYGRISRVMDWINRTIDVNKSPAENTRGLSRPKTS